jgi:hypothetical protein
MAATGVRPPITPVTWTIQDWYFDPANATGCASDNNTCTSSSCSAGGIGPCLTYAEVVQGRWETVSPRLFSFNQNFTFHALSSQTVSQAITDCVVVHPYLGGGTAGSDAGPSGGSAFIITGGGGVSSVSTTITALTAKNRAAQQPLSITSGTAPTAQLETLILNSTRTSYGFPVNSGASYDVTQPCTMTIGPGAILSCIEDDTWTNGDNLSLITLPRLCIAEAWPIILNKGHAEYSVLQIDDVGIIGNAGASSPENYGDSTFHIGPNVDLANMYIEKRVRLDGASDRNGISVTPGSANTVYRGSFTGGVLGASFTSVAGNELQTFLMSAGYLQNQSGGAGGEELSVFNGVFLDGDIRLQVSQTITFQGFNFFGQVENDGTIKVNQGVIDIQTAQGQTGASPQFGVWGTGTLNMQRGLIYYPAGATGGATTFGNLTGALKAANTTVVCIFQPNAVVTTLTCNQSLGTGTALDTALGGLGLGGCIGMPAAGFCNTTY